MRPPRPDRHALETLGVTLDLPQQATGGRWTGTSPHGEVVVDVLRARAAVSPAALCRRAATLASLRHPALAHVLGAVPSRGGVVTAQVRVAGPDLATLTRGRAVWTVPEVLGLLLELVDGLALLHDTGLAHGDVAPANVVLAPEGRPVLVDLLLGGTAPERGTAGWAAPERTTGVVTPAGDVHGLARIGEDLLAGAHGDGTEQLREVLRSACVPDPAARPTSRELAERLRALAITPQRRLVPDPLTLVGAAVRSGAFGEATRRVERPPRGRHRRRSPWHAAAVPAVCGTVVLGIAVAALLQGAPAGEAVAGEAAAGEVRDTADMGGAGAHGPRSARWGADEAARAAVGLTMRRARAVHEGRFLAQVSVVLDGSPAATSLTPPRRGEGHPSLEVDVVGEVRRSDQGWWVPVAVRTDGGDEQSVVLELSVVDEVWKVRDVVPAEAG